MRHPTDRELRRTSPPCMFRNMLDTPFRRRAANVRHAVFSMEDVASANMATEKPQQSSNDQVDRYDVIQQTRDDKNQDAGNQRNQRTGACEHGHDAPPSYAALLSGLSAALLRSLPAIASASAGFRLSTIEVGMRMVAPRSLVVS